MSKMSRLSAIEQTKVNDCSVGELIDVLIDRINTTNGLSFVSTRTLMSLIGNLLADSLKDRKTQ